MTQLVTINGKKRDLVDLIMDYEGGELSAEDTVFFFSHLVKYGLAWQLQGAYGRFAVYLMELGILAPNGDLVDGWHDKLAEG